MTTTNLTTLMRDLHERGQRRVPCPNAGCNHGAWVPCKACGSDVGTILDPSPAADLARAVADGVLAVEGEVCEHSWHRYGHSITETCPQCGRFYGRSGGLPALEGRVWWRVQTRRWHTDVHGMRREPNGAMVDSYCPDCHGTGLVLNPDWARDLAAGEFGALVGRIEQRLERVGFAARWEPRANGSITVFLCTYHPDFGPYIALPEFRKFGCHGPTRLDALLDALAQAAGVGSAA